VQKENCDRKSGVEKVWQEKCVRKSVKGKLWKEKCSKKVRHKNHSRKSAAEKPQQKKCGRKITRQWIYDNKTVATECYKRKKMYGSHMCSVEFMNQIEGFPCKYVGCPLGSLWVAIELI
jgi:hypothetical protein